jgi:Acyclic terpene utilisation family protein AtuA
MEKQVLRVANCSGFYGDRITAAREMVEGGPIDVLTGDWLAELTMLILAKTRKGASGGYARTFLTHMEHVLGTCLDRGIKVVSNAGGLNPAGLAEDLRLLADRLGLKPRIAYVDGDDLLSRFEGMRADGIDFANFDTGAALGDRTPMTANAYQGGWGIAEALKRGADVVVTGRVTDAAVVVGPTAAHFGWQRDDWNALAGSVVAGHIIECGCQATGGNYSFFQEVPGLERPGFPIAEMYADGSCVITKHEGTGGLVSVGTVTAQLLYEIQSTRYLNPDVTTNFDSIQLEQVGENRVLVSGVIGQPPPPTTKVCINLDGGYRNQMTFCLTGLDIEAKADLVTRTFWAHVAGGPESFQQATTRLVRSDRDNPASNEEAVATLTFTVKDPDERKVGRSFANVGVEMALASYPGMFGTGAPGPGHPFGVYWPALVPSALVPCVVHLDGSPSFVVEATPGVEPMLPTPPTVASEAIASEAIALYPSGATERMPLGRVMGARSGDKGGNANIGVWTKNAETYEWLRSFLTVERLQTLLPETSPLKVVRYDLPNLSALNFVIHGILEEGVAASTRMDAQAKGLGEYLRAKHVDVPAELVARIS